MADRYAVVTGAGTGIGRAAAQALLAEGWMVAVLGRRLEPLEETIAGHGRGVAIPADVGDRAQVEAAFAQIKERFGRLDLLFNNAGRGAPAVDFDELPLEDWRGVVAANLDGTFYCAQAAYRIMKHQSPKGGRIINNGSISAHAPRPGAAAYTATKHAVTGLTKQIALDGRKHDITASQIDIGNAATPMTERMTKGVLQPDGSMMVEPRMDVAHVGRTVAHMASMPLDANIPFLTIMATKMPWLGRG
ncbi:NADP-dependent 3-hydroxy acid dehydrogenase YdfG [Roseomonas rosea]|uniref:NADP-dependent 3-hydroxy acid dehydrogenase YdfG n=1 Tax=Muricoccus roseus TaxID=198092 RepID=A0A1M6KR80_9PROT|nr:SDR family oxidoreductase [Roseomonas rosea]SHJ61459.1 NADP-dependent 3-hydroxy acid dehydrogenase YdfG [Roseomonas rosea]